MLNPVRVTTLTHVMIDFGKEEVFTLTEVAIAIRRLKSGKVVGKNEIRPEMSKALNGEGVRWLTRVFQINWKLGKHQKTYRKM